MALSEDGKTALIGCPGADHQKGAAWLFRRSGPTWSLEATKLTGSGQRGTAGAGTSVTLSAHGRTALVGGPYDNDSAGAAWIFTPSR